MRSIMKNPAVQPSDELNDFTTYLQESQSDTYVRLRNGMICRPIFKCAEDETEEDVFHLEDWSMCWNLDGTSVTSHDYDMIEILEN